MKRNVKTIVLAVIIISVGASFVPAKKIQPPVKKEATTMFRDYLWYYDFERTEPVGIACDINEEVARLQSDWGGYTFSSSPSMGLLPYEWGYFMYYIPVIIYSDLEVYGCGPNAARNKKKTQTPAFCVIKSMYQ